jgi:hypothetical protein
MVAAMAELALSPRAEYPDGTVEGGETNEILERIEAAGRGAP